MFMRKVFIGCNSKPDTYTMPAHYKSRHFDAYALARSYKYILAATLHRHASAAVGIR